MSQFGRFIVHRSSFIILLCLPFLVRGDGPAEPPDPIALQRVWLTPDAAARQEERVRQGLLVRMPRDDFEALVRQAARAEAARKDPPRLVAASYHAQLTDGGLAGSPEWTVIHTAPGPGLLPLAPLDLALQPPSRLIPPSATLEAPRLTPLHPAPGQPAGSRDAYVGDFDGHNPSLLIDAPGEYSVTAGWSARAEARPEGLQFDLKFPAGPAAVLVLDLPPDKAPVMGDGGASGPEAADDPNLKKWTIPCGGRSEVSFWIRPADPAPAVRARLDTTQVLAPDGLDATYAFSLKALHQGARDLVFECDPALRPYDVDAPGLDRWELAPPGRLTVHLLAPLEEGTVRIRCLGPLAGAAAGPGPVAWTSPGVRLSQSVNGGETLVLKVHPDLRLADVASGSFRLQGAAAETGPDGRTEFQRLSFLGGGVAEAGGRPRVVLQPHAAEFRARQVAWWRVDQASLTLQISYDVSYGRLFQLAVRLPADWEVDHVDLAPDDLRRDWTVRTEKGGRVLLVDLQRALTPAEKRGARLTVGLRPARPGDVAGKELSFPDAEPLGARFREGALAVGFDERTHQIRIETAAAQAPPDDDGPWRKDIPSYYYPYRDQAGAGRPAPAGRLMLLPRQPQVRAQCTSDVTLTAGQVSVDTRLLLEAEQGSPESVDLYLSATAAPAVSGDPWNWRAEQGGVEVRAARRLPDAEALADLIPLGAADPLGVAALGLVRPRGECWRVTFSRPLRVHEPIALHAVLAPKAGGDPLAVPLTAVLDASRMEGEVTLNLAAANPPQVELLGLREAAAAARPHGTTAWRTFRYGGAAVGLALAGPLAGDDRPPEAAVDWAALTTYVPADGPPEHHYRFKVSHWSQTVLPLQMPAGARLVAFQVDGVWSPRPPAAEDGPAGPVIDLPAPARAGRQAPGGPHLYEVFYTTGGAAAGLWARVEAPAPSPRVPPAVFRRLWRLAPELSPLDDGRLRRRPGPGESTPSAAPPLRPQDLFRAAPEAPPFAWPWPTGWDGARRPDVLPEALLSLRDKEKQTKAIDAVLVDAAADLRRHGEFLIVDASALADADVGPSRAVTLPPESAEDEAPPWDGLGVAAVCVRGGCLLTTARQRAAWGEATGAGGAPEAVESAAGEAARWGRDSSGRFQAAAVWSDAASEETSPLPSPEMDLASWTEWEPAPGSGDSDAVVVVRRPLFDAAGWVVALLLGPAFVAAGRRRKAARLWLLLFWLGAAATALLWLPGALRGLAWPALLRGCVFAVAWRVASAERGPAKSPAKARAVVAAAGSGAALLLVAVCGRGAPADAPPPAVTVYLVHGDDSPDKAFALVPPELLDRLRTLARPGAGPAAVVVGAEYAGEVAGRAAEIDAKFQVLCFTEEATGVALPLDGVQVCAPPNSPGGEVRVGGMAVRATALPAPQAGLAVPIRGGATPGGAPRLEVVDVHFRTPVTPADEEREVQLTIPRLPQSRMLLRLPRGSTHAQAPPRHGALNPAKGDSSTLDVDIGALSVPLRVRWVPERGPAARPEVQVKEAYLWDLGVDASGLTAMLSYTVSPAGTDALAVRLPPGLEPLSVEARRRDGTPVRLRDWKVVPEWADRTLVIDFPSLESGDIDVTLGLAPRAPWPASFALPLPSPILSDAAGGKGVRPTASYLAYRTHGLSVERVNPVGVTGLTALENFAPFWPAATRPDPRSLTYAATLSHEDENHAPGLGLTVRPAAPADDARVDVEVHVGPTQADVRAAAVLTARDGAPSLVEWQVRSAAGAPAFTATAVTGPAVRRWSQDGGRVLAWLDPSAKGDARLELTGWLPLAAGPRLELPAIRIASAASQETTIRLVPAGGVALAEAGRLNLTPIGPLTPTPLPPGERGRGEGADGALAYTAGGREDYGGAWRVQAAPPRARVYTVAALSNRRFTFVSVVDIDPAFGGVEAAEVRVRNWAGNVDIKCPAGVRSRPLRRGPDDWSWALEQDAAKPGRLRVTLSGEQPAEAAVGAVLPAATVPGAAGLEQWAAVGGTDLTAEPALGLAPVEGPPADLADAAAARGKAASVWKITGPQWRLNLAPRDASSSAAPVEVYLAEQRAAPADAGRWLHEAVYWLRHDANADLNLTLPADAEVLSVAIDDDETPPLQAEPRRLWLPLTGRPAVCRVRVRWRYATEDFSRPDLDRPAVQGAADGPGVWTVFAPPGWRPEKDNNKEDLQSGLTQAAALSWRRAEALLRLSGALAQQGADGGDAQLTETQRRFYAEVRRAHEELEASPEAAAPGWPEGRKPKEVLQDLLGQNERLARERHFDAVRAEAEAAVEAQGAGPAEGAAAWAVEGRPLYAWRDGGAAAPKAAFTSGGGRDVPAWAAPAAWLLALLLIGLASLSRSVGAWSRTLWPEQIALLGLIGWWATGSLTVVVCGLFLLAVVGRVGTVFVAVGRLLRRPAARSKSTAQMPALPESSGS